MGWFDSDAVKNLKKQSEFFGGLIADQAFGELPPGAADEMINSETQRAQLRKLFDAAAKELGDDKALKKAVNAAADFARMHAQVRSFPVGQIPQQAEETIREMLAPH